MHEQGATLTHLNILNNGFFAGERMGLTPDDTLCVPVPLYHCFGLVLGKAAAARSSPCSVALFAHWSRGGGVDEQEIWRHSRTGRR
jgi:acyl-CoA synthetase (AMP-forming)/AMP-acid ligase II